MSQFGRLSQTLSHYWSNKSMLEAMKNAEMVNGIKGMISADYIVRNDEAAGSIPASSTKDLPLRSVNLPCVEFPLHLSLKINQTPQPGFASNP